MFILALTGLALAQTPAPGPAPLISAYYSLDNGATSAYRWLAIDPPLTVTVDANGRPHLGVPATLTVTASGQQVGSASKIDLSAGNGVTLALSSTPEAIMIQPSVDTSVIAHRVDPPAGPGPAVDISGASLGSGSWAADAGYFYFTLPNATGAGGFVWARVALATTW